jgi:hypothetical protein
MCDSRKQIAELEDKNTALRAELKHAKLAALSLEEMEKERDAALAQVQEGEKREDWAASHLAPVLGVYAHHAEPFKVEDDVIVWQTFVDYARALRAREQRLAGALQECGDVADKWPDTTHKEARHEIQGLVGTALPDTPGPISQTEEDIALMRVESELDAEGKPEALHDAIKKLIRVIRLNDRFGKEA